MTENSTVAAIENGTENKKWPANTASLYSINKINRDYMYLFGIMYMCIAAVFSTILVSLFAEKNTYPKTLS